MSFNLQIIKVMLCSSFVVTEVDSLSFIKKEVIWITSFRLPPEAWFSVINIPDPESSLQGRPGHQKSGHDGVTINSFVIHLPLTLRGSQPSSLDGSREETIFPSHSGYQFRYSNPGATPTSCWVTTTLLGEYWCPISILYIIKRFKHTT